MRQKNGRHRNEPERTYPLHDSPLRAASFCPFHASPLFLYHREWRRRLVIVAYRQRNVDRRQDREDERLDDANERTETVEDHGNAELREIGEDREHLVIGV